jgi:nitrogen-specific signal transduction histidine kinase
MANKLAHQINNPLQRLINVAYLAAERQRHDGEKSLGQELSIDLQRLSSLVNEVLANQRLSMPNDGAS